jgi:hypothetical protein
MADARSLCPLLLLRSVPPDALLPWRLGRDDPPAPDEDLLLLLDDLPLPVARLPELLCFFWVEVFDLCPLLRRAVDACFMVMLIY